MKHQLVILIFAAIVTLFTACHRNDNFTTEKWKSGDGLQFPLRNEILDDLIKTHPLKGMTYKQVQHLLSYPDGRDSVSFYYQIIETYNNLGKRKYIKNLVLYMKKDSVITGFKVVEKSFKKPE
jgi:hypothetical protein